MLNIILYSVQFSCSVVSDSLRTHESQHARPPCPSPTSGAYSNSCPSSRWCHPAISASVVPFSSCPQSLPASGSFPMSQLFAWGGQSIGISVLASVLPMNTQDCSPLGWTDWISLQSKGLSRVFSNTTVQTHQFFGSQLSSCNVTPLHIYSYDHNKNKSFSLYVTYHFILLWVFCKAKVFSFLKIQFNSFSFYISHLLSSLWTGGVALDLSKFSSSFYVI